MAQPSICAVVQGNLRNGTDEVLACLSKHFKQVILSTWDDEPLDTLRSKGIDIVTSRKPESTGYTHRNYQRLGTAAGLRRAEELGATHVLKWRTDMLPTNLNVPQLMEWSEYDPPQNLGARLVTCAFRNLSVEPDWFSSIPDYFAFSSLRVMKMLWDDEGFDYSQDMNVPEGMVRDCGVGWRNTPDVKTKFGPETELYAVFKSRLQAYTGKELSHPTIAKTYMRLFDHRHLGVCWFGQSGFRSIIQATQHPWWTESTWFSGTPTISKPGYPESSFLQFLTRKCITPMAIKNELRMQERWYKNSLALAVK